MSFTTSKRILTAALIVVGASVLSAPSVKAQATDSGDVTGTVTAINTAVYTAPATATLDPTNGNTDMSFGTLAIQNNDPDGWILEVQSLNGSTLVDPVSNDAIAYSGFTGERGGADLTADLSTPATDDTLETVGVLTCANAVGCTYNLDADIDSADIDGKSAGTYADTLTFTLTAQ